MSNEKEGPKSKPPTRAELFQQKVAEVFGDPQLKEPKDIDAIVNRVRTGVYPQYIGDDPLLVSDTELNKYIKEAASKGIIKADQVPSAIFNRTLLGYPARVKDLKAELLPPDTQGIQLPHERVDQDLIAKFLVRGQLKPPDGEYRRTYTLYPTRRKNPFTKKKVGFPKQLFKDARLFHSQEDIRNKRAVFMHSALQSPEVQGAIAERIKKDEKARKSVARKEQSALQRPFGDRGGGKSSK